MNILILGPQGSGKSTQAQLLSLDLGLPLIQMGEMLRTIALIDDSPTAELIRESIKKGRLVPLSIVAALVKKRLGQSDCQKGFILDGYPRDRKQLESLGLTFDKVFYINISDEEGIKRLMARKRDDDKPEVIAKRLKIYHTETKPILDIFRKGKVLEEINGERSVEEIHQDILDRLKSQK